MYASHLYFLNGTLHLFVGVEYKLSQGGSSTFKWFQKHRWMLYGFALTKQASSLKTCQCDGPHLSPAGPGASPRWTPASGCCSSTSSRPPFCTRTTRAAAGPPASRALPSSPAGGASWEPWRGACQESYLEAGRREDSGLEGSLSVGRHGSH